MKFPLFVSFAAAVLFTSAHPAVAADLSIDNVAAGESGLIMAPVVPDDVRIVPPCFERWGWLNPAPLLLECAPQVYFKPTSVRSLNLIKGIQRTRRPYPEIYRND